jgi:citrate synthase
MSEPDWAQTWLGSSGPDHITVAGRDLAGEVMGRLTLTDLAFLLVTRREPTPGERRLTDAVLVSLADHGLTPSALSTRLTHTGAPEAVQGAVAAGLLGAGSVFLGPAGDTAEFLAAGLAGVGGPTGKAPDRALGRALVESRLEEGLRVPGLGHPVHRRQDPRTARLCAIAEEEDLLGPHLRLLGHVAAAHEELTGKHLPVNGAGAGGAALADLGLRPEVIRGFVLIARTAGLVGHLAEELEQPMGMALWREVDERSGGPVTEQPARRTWQGP